MLGDFNKFLKVYCFVFFNIYMLNFNPINPLMNIETNW
jgi:hypothetical protein